MNATFFGLAFLSALNPKLLGVDLLLMNMRRRDLMFVCFLLGGMGVALTVGLLDVLVLHEDAIKTQGSVSAGFTALHPRQPCNCGRSAGTYREASPAYARHR